METQQQFIEEVLRLKAENPDMDIKVCVDNATLCDDYGWTAQQITNISISSWYEADERILTDEEDIFYHVLEYMEMYETEEEALCEAARLVQNKVICIFTST